MLKEKNTLNLKLKDFEGPLDLLDTLIRERKMDILDLNIAELTSQYLEYIQEELKKTNRNKLNLAQTED